MKSIQIVTHCYAVKLPIYAKMLTAQISSLILWQPHHEVLLTVCCNQDDALTLKAIDGLGSNPTPMVKVQAMLLSLPDLFRRAIGRNRAAKQSTADIVWHCDADYLFARDCIDSICAVEFGEFNSVIPKKAWMHRSHYEGSAELERVEIGELFEPDLSLYQAWHPKEAIGGLQIVRGDFARQGYLDGTKWQTPVHDVSEGFQNTAEDRKYRRLELKSNTMKADIHGVHRMRHVESSFESAAERNLK